MPIIVNDNIVTQDSSLKTYTLADLIFKAMPFCGGEVSGKNRAFLADFLNQTLGEIFADSKQVFMLGQSQLETVAEYATGTVSINKGENTFNLAGGGALDTSHVGRKLLVGGQNTAYEITERVSASQGKVKFKFMAENVSAVAFRIVQDSYNLPSDFDQPKLVDQKFSNIWLQILSDLPSAFRVDDRPRLCKITLDGKLVLWPAPKRIIHIIFDYYRQFARETVETNYFQIPDKYVATILYGAAAKYWLTRGQDRTSLGMQTRFQSLYNDGRKQIINDKYRPTGVLPSFRPYDQPGVVNGLDDSFSPINLLGTN